MPKMITQNMIHALMVWFDSHRREMPWRGSQDPYHIWVSEMMLQQTQVITVENYYPRWIKRFPDVYTLAEANLEDILKIWEGLGYYTRARNFYKGAKYIVEHALDKHDPFPHNYEEWLKVPGVGPYTAAAVSSIAYGFPAAVVDSNVKRVMSRLLCLDDIISTQKYHRMLFEIMNKAFYNYHPGWVNQAWMELGSLKCTPNPVCSTCPLKDHCCAFLQEKVKDFPKKNDKKKIPTRYGAAFIIQNKNEILLLRRPEEGFLGGLWEYPGFTLKEPDPDYLQNFCEEHGIEIEEELPYIAHHTYSHFHQDLKLYRAKLIKTCVLRDWIESRYVTLTEQNNLPRSKMTIKISKILSDQP